VANSRTGKGEFPGDDANSTMPLSCRSPPLLGLDGNLSRVSGNTKRQVCASERLHAFLAGNFLKEPSKLTPATAVTRLKKRH